MNTFNNRFFLKISIFLLFFLLCNKKETFAQQKIVLDEISAVVGDKIILQSEIQQGFLQAQSQGIAGDNLDCEVLDQLLLEKMFVNQAILDSVEVSIEEVDNELDTRIRYFISLFNGDVSRMEEYYGKTLVEMKEDFRDDVRSLLLARRMQQSVISNISVTPAEVKDFFNAIPQDSIPYFNAEIELGQLVVEPKPTAEQVAAVKTQLRDLVAQVESGEATFDKLAATYSEDPGSAVNGGDLGFMERGQLVPEFEGAAFKLKNGEISGVVETQYGFHIIQMLERRGDRIHVRHILIKPKVSEAEKMVARQYLDSIRVLIVEDSLSFKDAVEQFSEDENGKKLGGLIISPQTGSSVFEMDQLDPNIYFAIDTLKEGNTSQPIDFQREDGVDMFRLLHVYTRTEPHYANLKDDYNKVQNIVKIRKQNEVMLQWLNKMIPKTYISLNEQFHDCDLLQKWLN